MAERGEALMSGYDAHTDPVMQQVRELQQAGLRLVAGPPPAGPEPIDLTVVLPPIRVNIAVQPPPVHVQPPEVRVNVPAAPAAKEIVFDRDSNGWITGARLTKEKR